MAITSITIIQDNIQDGSNLLAAQSPVTFLAEAAWTTAAPDTINVEILDESDTLIDTYKAIPYADRAGVRTFAFQASLAIRSLLGSFDDFEQDAHTWAYCEGLTGSYKIKFVDPATPATNDEVLIEFAHAARQFSEGCNMEDQFDNDTDFYLAPKDGVVYVYFYNPNETIIEEVEYTATANGVLSPYDGKLFIEGIGAGGAGAGDDEEMLCGGGAGGQYANVGVNINAGDIIDIVVPSAKLGTAGAGAQGGDAIVDVEGGEVLRAKGGAGGTNLAGGAGSLTGGVGDLVYKGGDGGAPSGVYSGGGGGAAGELGNGGSAVVQVAGSGNGVNSGDGGEGLEDTGESNGNPGQNYGGGGSGAVSLGSTLLGGDGAQGFVKLSYIATQKGFWRYKTTADQIKNISATISSVIYSKQVIPLDTCTGDLVLKYLDKNGHYRFFNCNKYYATRDLPEKLGSINRFLTDILTDQSDSKNVGYRNKRTIEAVAEVQADYLGKFADLYTSPRVYLKVGSGDEAKDWLLVEVRANDNIVRRRKANTGAISLTITLPEHYTISMI